MTRWRLAAIVVLALACGSGAGPEHEGDRAYAEGRYEQAIARYRSAAGRTPSGRVWAKLGAAALHAGELSTAVEAYRRLAAEDPTRAEEAADGLDAVAQQAERRNDLAALHDAVLGLRAIAPERPVNRYALALVRRSGAVSGDALALFPAALAVAPDARVFDSLLVAYAGALHEAGGCEPAVPVYQAVVRRAASAGLRDSAESALAPCALTLGLAALNAGHSDDAVQWLVQAVRADSASWVGRRALIGLGDARVSQGDILGAAIAFQAALDARIGPADSLSELAAARLNALGAPPRPQDSLPHEFPQELP